MFIKGTLYVFLFGIWLINKSNIENIAVTRRGFRADGRGVRFRLPAIAYPRKKRRSPLVYTIDARASVCFNII